MKDIKTKPQATTKSVKNAPKVADRFAKEAVKDVKTVSKWINEHFDAVLRKIRLFKPY